MDEPLKEKKREYRIGFGGSIPIFVFDDEDVKSAVEGLKSAVIDKFDDRCSDDAGPILALIDKWFPDAIDNDTNRK